MDKATRNILIGVGVVVLGGGGYLIWQNRKDSGKGGKLSGLLKKGKTFKMGYIQNGYIHVAGDDRAEATPYLKKGTKVTIKGGNDDMNGERTIKAIWKDGNGKVGAFKTDEFSVGYNTSQNRDYENKATISIAEDE
tara:strand:- start:513 stop:920 length:408 start_codon:yes stop_codon:yes gene_type:complete